MESKTLNRKDQAGFFDGLQQQTYYAVDLAKRGILRLCDRVSVLVAVIAAVLLASGSASAQFVPVEVEPVQIFDLAALGTNVLTIMVGALGAVALYKISIGIGKKVIAYFGGRG